MKNRAYNFVSLLILKNTRQKIISLNKELLNYEKRDLNWHYLNYTVIFVKARLFKFIFLLNTTLFYLNRVYFDSMQYRYLPRLFWK